MRLITDRTEADVLLGNEKGRYSCDDLNRVESFVEALLKGLPQLDIRLDLETKTDWTFAQAFSPETWPVKSQMERYLGNVHALCQALGLYPELPESMDFLTFQGANQMEKALFLAEKRAEAVRNTYRFSGELIAGEE